MKRSKLYGKNIAKTVNKLIRLAKRKWSIIDTSVIISITEKRPLEMKEK